MAKNKPRHILVIRLSAMGDVAMTVPVLIALTLTYPELRITVLTKPFFKPIFSKIPNVLVYEAEVNGRHKGIFGLWKLYKELKTLSIHAVADLHNVLRSTILKQYFKQGGIPFFQIDKGRAEKKELTAKKKKTFKPIKTTHQRYADVFEHLGFPINLNLSQVLPHQSIPKKFEEITSAYSNQLIGIAPFAAFKGKMYPLERMEEVVNRLNIRNSHKIIVFGGGKEEQKLVEPWENKFVNCVSVVGKLSFVDELALISNLNLMLAMDSGNAHLAAMYGVPTITLWGVTHPYTGFYPFGQGNHTLLADRDQFPLIPTSVYGNKMPKGYERVMETILPEEVFHKIEDMIENNIS